MARGYHRRQVERWRHTRLLAVSIYNSQRGPDDGALEPQDFMPLPGDEQALPPAEMSDEEYAAALARAAQLDADLL